MTKIEINLDNLDGTFDISTGASHEVSVKRCEAHWLELEDALFHSGSAVMMPDGVASDGRPAQNRVSGLSMLKVTYLHAEANAAQKLLIAGHTDSVGGDAGNEELSLLRADMIRSLLEGDRAGYVGIAKDHSSVRDYEQILRWAHVWLGWDCDPGDVDDVRDERTKAAVERFQESYSQAPDGETIDIDGDVGAQTWGAFFELYMKRLAELMGIGKDELGTPRGHLKWLYGDRKHVGCGEYHPASGAYADGHESQADRRVEVIFYEPGEEPESKPAKICHSGGVGGAKKCPLFNGFTHRLRRLPKKAVDVKAVDPHFAPGHETLSVTYRLEGVAGSTVEMEVTSPHYADGPIFKRTLTASEKSDGVHTVSWDGKASCAAGDLAGHYISPLYAPYTVKVHDGGAYADSATFKVLYHSIELERGAYTKDGKEPADEKAWVQLKLNELGYFAGPVGQDFDDYLKKAIIRYKVNHKDFHELDYSKYTDAITPELKAALKAGDCRRQAVVGDAVTDPTKPAKIFVEALTYEGKEFGQSMSNPAKTKAAKEAERLNRPLIPLCAKVFVRSKSGAKVFAPGAVGPVRINWMFEYGNEDLTKLPANTAASPSRVQNYVKKALELQGGRVGTTGDNCPSTFGGIREAAATNYKAPTVLGTRYEGFDLQDDGGQKRVFSKACVDKANYPAHHGKAGFLFRPSFVGGDDYKLRAEIDFTGLPNQAELEAAHGVVDEATRPHVESGTFTIWRDAKVAMLINWPARTTPNPWAAIRKEFLDAFIDLDVGSVTTKTIAQIVSKSDYKEIVAKRTNHKKLSIRLRPNAVVGVDLPKQGALSAADYKTALRTFANDDYYGRIYKDLHKKITAKVRETHPTGFIIVDFLTHLPVNVRTAPPGNKTVSAKNKNYITWSFSVGLPDSMIFSDQKDPDKVYYVVSHEMGHNFWLKHYEHSGGVAADHDTAEHNCTMSYSSSSCAHPIHMPGIYTPHFCGKCNVKLRGWNIGAAGIPAGS